MGALTLDRDVFGDVADDPFATGPALLILFILVTISSLITALDPGTPGTLLGKFAGGVLGNSIGRLLVVLLVHVAGRTLRGTGEFTRTMRVIAFALVPQAIGFLGPLPTLGPLFSLVATLLTLLAVWIAVQEALGLRRLTAALIPIVGLLLFAFASVALAVLISGTALTVEMAMGQLGLGEGWYLTVRPRGPN